jgi:hypothetical protein
LDNEEQG